MSREQKDRLFRNLDFAGRWVNMILLGICIYFLQAHFEEWKEIKKDIDEIKQDVSALTAKVDFLEKYDLKAKR